ncbi:MAG: hypothetical protein QM791_19245 [Ferruginibacter sp.]
MYKKKPEVDVVLDILNEAIAHFPSSTFIQSLLFQYQERGGLSKKQLQGLYDKASKLGSLSSAKLATLEAIILKKNAKHRSPKPGPVSFNNKEEIVGQRINAILNKYPAHKRVLFYKQKYDTNGVFTPAEKAELEKFYSLLLK